MTALRAGIKLAGFIAMTLPGLPVQRALIAVSPKAARQFPYLYHRAVTRWLEGTLRADVYVSAPSSVGSRPDATLDPSIAARLAATPGVAQASTSRGVVGWSFGTSRQPRKW